LYTELMDEVRQTAPVKETLVCDTCEGNSCEVPLLGTGWGSFSNPIAITDVWD